MDDVKKITRPSSKSSNSPPPNCAICLGPCTNKCVLDSCMHQFCFGCVLKWSKIKAECPLCKQPFTSIIHNIKSNNEYDEHVVEPTDNTATSYNVDNYLYLPSRHPMRHFQFRTRLTVDLREELEITYFAHNLNTHRFRRDVSSTAFRRSIYTLNLWSNAPPDITGRYRMTNPEFYRMNPGAINRLAPWLNRELNALLADNTQQVMTLVDVILTNLREHHIKGRFFKNLLSQYFGLKTTHFIHEFYNFMQSPFDMVGYDRHVLYTHRHIEIVSDIDSSDSDVQVIETETPARVPVQSNEIIEIRSDESDSDVIIISDSEIQNNNPAPSSTTTNVEPETSNNNRKPILPLKIRLKCNRQSREEHKKSKRRHRHFSTSSDSSSKSNHVTRKRKKMRRRRMSSTSSASSSSVSSLRMTEKKPKPTAQVNALSSDDEPLLYLQRKLKSSNVNNRCKSKSTDRKYLKGSKEQNSNGKSCDRKSYTPPLCDRVLDLSTHKIKHEEAVVKSEISDVVCPGPSHLPTYKLKRENNNWYCRPAYVDSDDE